MFLHSMLKLTFIIATPAFAEQGDRLDAVVSAVQETPQVTIIDIFEYENSLGVKSTCGRVGVWSAYVKGNPQRFFAAEHNGKVTVLTEHRLSHTLTLSGMTMDQYFETNCGRKF